jgi:hypothetical protein
MFSIVWPALRPDQELHPGEGRKQEFDPTDLLLRATQARRAQTIAGGRSGTLTDSLRSARRT